MIERMPIWDGTISSDEFYVAACSFVELWKEHNDALPQWSWVNCSQKCWISPSKVDGYLSLENVILPKSAQEHNDHEASCEDECSFSNEDEIIDDAILVQDDDHERRYYDFHVVYNQSYKVPVLHLRAHYIGGQQLSVNVIEKDISINSGDVLGVTKSMFLTQEEHPYLNRPWCMLHPCGTSECMKLLFSNKDLANKIDVPIEKYLVAWFSVVGQLFGFKLPFGMLHNVNYRA
ncbi:ubiquitin-protein ligase [Lithospermum erythrorhizon]|uniref:Ubiquitin-like-conjugating enzyme ATG10 n=1 Tax=Lithospermum erythrorhizon TaxID=34254 RepID=A0AAV3QYT9_LITER